jgi:hypothetical protein
MLFFLVVSQKPGKPPLTTLPELSYVPVPLADKLEEESIEVELEAMVILLAMIAEFRLKATELAETVMLQDAVEFEGS